MLTMSIGSYAFPIGQVGFVPRISPRMNSRGIPVSRVVSIDLTGDLFADGPAANMQKRKDLEKAANLKDFDFSIKADKTNGGSEILRYRVSEAMRGMTMTSLTWPNPNAGQLVNLSTFNMTIEGEFKADGLTAGDTLEYTETIEIAGNAGPEIRWMYPLNARPVAFQARKFTTVRIVQKGQATGWGDYPRKIPDPKFTQARYYRRDETRIVKGNASGSGLKMYPIAWSYFFELDYLPVNLLPTVWPVK